MVVKKGYKQTDIGIIPSDWVIKKLGDCLLATPSYGVNAAATNYTDNLPAYIRITDITDDGYYSQEKKASVNAIGIEKYFLSNGDLVFARTGASVGKTYLYNPKDGILAFAGFLIRVKPNPSKLLPEYLANYVQTKTYWNWVQVMSMRSGQPGINGNEYAQLPIPIPQNINEQRTIAAALSDMDTLLAALDALIAKKRLVKQGAMQELLTGKSRLPGFAKQQGYKQTEIGIFPEDWDIVPLKSISSMHGRIGWQGLKQTEFTMKQDDPFLITGMNFKDGEIRWNEVYHIPDIRYEMAKEIQLKTGDVLMTKDGTIGKILYVDQIPSPGKASLNSHLLVFRPLNNKYIPKFMFYQLNSKTFHNHIEQEKSGTTFFGITQEAVGKYNAFLPSIPEQTAIAEILSEMDAEIAALEGRREKTRLLKEGMMQELLTGRIRLV